MLTTHAHTRAPSDDRSQPAPSAAEGSTRSAHTDCGESNTQDNLLEHLQARSTFEQSREQSQSRPQSTPKPRAQSECLPSGTPQETSAAFCHEPLLSQFQ